MGFLRSLDQVAASDAPRVGGKAYNCARLKQAGVPVPDGLALPAGAAADPAAQDELRAWLARFPAGVLLAVRSSAADEDSAGHSFAGIHETRLNVPREHVLEAVRACADSVRSPRALAYRRALGLPTDSVAAGVLVQVMVQPVAAGVAFTVNLVTGAREEMVINASWGLGEALVSGLVEPDEFRLRKSDGEVMARRLGTKGFRAVAELGVTRLVQVSEEEQSRPTLSDEQLRALAALLVRLENQFDASQDVEWCHDGRQFWILQSRLVTAAPRATPDIEWTRANVREVLPDLPSPQTAVFCINLLNNAFERFYGRLLAPESELGPVARVFFGRVYFNLTRLLSIGARVNTPPAVLLRALGHPERIRLEDEVVTPASPSQRLRALPDALRLAGRQVVLPWRIRREFAVLRRFLSDFEIPPAAFLSEADLWARMFRWKDSSEGTLEAVLALGGLTLYEMNLQGICRRVGFPYERLGLLLAAGEKSVSAQQAFDLLALARSARSETQAREFFLRPSPAFERWREELRGTAFLPQFEEYLAKYGHRGAQESDWALPRYREDPSPLLAAVAVHLRADDTPAPESIRARQQAEAARAWEDFRAHLRPWQRPVLLPLARWLLGRVKRMYAWREQLRSEMMRVGAALRPWHLALAARFVARGALAQPEDYFFLTVEEVEQAVVGALPADELRARVARRRAERAAHAQIEMPLLMRESELPALIRRANATLPETELTLLEGLCVSPGCAEGEVVVLRDPTEFSRMKSGAILVAPATDPGWTPLFTLAAGVIVEVGGTLSHASIVAREYGLPALANVKDATRLLKDGDRVRLDASGGFVQMLARAGAKGARAVTP